MDKVEMNKIIEKIIELSLNGMPYKEALNKCIDTDQSNQCTEKYSQFNFNIED
ncbi:hypothetical protein P5E62_02375 [Clostridium perfringens]|uniref:hypothetical protein n=1 Tax=Clostridium perfringens TaxID=1502 RepID=UPI0013D1B169|nr:hypothetical protein [Clostridium perfringens]MDK0708095.1 hypothetical protein [Clostridium perfringens]MDK0711015.1 hypothetical protein [Clostridium perfringens]MDM0667897.1 hypothetical protein [Clostridium perfringens]MDM0980767.1 hypothetical protein [Clostridium perfringens]UUR85984.1 hypothetical protein NQ194_10350 [Clostridium perfringens]